MEGTSAKQSLHKTGGKSGGTGTKPPVVEFNEYLDVDANVNRLEHLEHIREFVVDAFGEILKRFIGCNGSILLDDDDERNTFVNAITVSHFLKLAKLVAGLTMSVLLFVVVVLLTNGDCCVSPPLFRRRLSNDLMPGMASRSTLVVRGRRADVGDAWGIAIDAVTKRRPPRESNNVA